MEDKTRKTLRSFVHLMAPKMDQQYLSPSQQIFSYYCTVPEDVSWHLMFHHHSA